MREILFRGKRKSDGKWSFGYVVPTVTNCYDKGVEIIDTEGISYDELDYFHPVFSSDPVDPETVGQFTGLTDANGKRIFEGDFVRIKYAVNGRKRTFLKGIVKYEEGAFFVHISSHRRQTKGLVYAFTSSFHTEDEGLFCEVIGNIHDSPELLGGAEDGK